MFKPDLAEANSIIDLLLHNTNILWWLAATSVVTFAVSLIGIPWLAVRIPADYFAAAGRRPLPWARRHPVIRFFLFIVKNIFGALLLLAGIAMLVLPGQGLLTMAIAILVLDFPGKYRVERWCIGHKPILNAINWMRCKAGVAPIIL